VFARIDHIGVAVEDLDAAIALHESTYGMALAHRETMTEQGV
jgi:methylmalonyl-CoA/ethylmalonyl-CoA epimerase